MRFAAITSAALCAAVAAGAANAAPPKRDLVEISRGQDYRGVTWVASIDRASRKKVAEGIFVIEYQVPEKMREDGSTQTITEYIVDCATPQYQTTRSYRADAAGKVLSEEPIGRLRGGWQYGKRPDAQPLMNAVCTG